MKGARTEIGASGRDARSLVRVFLCGYIQPGYLDVGGSRTGNLTEMPTGGGVSRIERMGSGGATAIAGCAGAVSGGNVTTVGDSELGIDRAEKANTPGVLLVNKVDAAVVPGVPISVEAARRLNRDE